jgi:SAM-dependent methyltransferase
MAYKLYTLRDPAEQDKNQWFGRELLDEVEICEHRTLANLFEKFLPSQGLIVEAGCGLGGWVKFLRLKGYHIVGIDRDPNVIQRAKEADPEMPVEIGNVVKTSFADGSLAAWISLGVIEHFEEGPQASLAEGFRILAPGGVALITVPSNCLARRLIVHPLRSTLFWLLKCMGKRIFFGEYRYRQKEIESQIAKSGFRLIGFDWDEIKAADKERHIGIYADFPFLRSSHGVWRLNWLGRFYASIVRALPAGFHINGYFFVAQKPIS